MTMIGIWTKFYVDHRLKKFIRSNSLKTVSNHSWPFGCEDFPGLEFQCPAMEERSWKVGVEDRYGRGRTQAIRIQFADALREFSRDKTTWPNQFFQSRIFSGFCVESTLIQTRCIQKFILNTLITTPSSLSDCQFLTQNVSVIRKLPKYNFMSLLKMPMRDATSKSILSIREIIFHKKHHWYMYIIRSRVVVAINWVRKWMKKQRVSGLFVTSWLMMRILFTKYLSLCMRMYAWYQFSFLFLIYTLQKRMIDHQKLFSLFFLLFHLNWYLAGESSNTARAGASLT